MCLRRKPRWKLHSGSVTKGFDRSNHVPGVMLFGLKMAALAVLGDNVVAFGDGVAPLLIWEDEGVKAGESTLRRFFML